MERREFLRAAAAGAGALVLAGRTTFGEEHYPIAVDESLWQGINRLKDPDNETILEKLHVPVITAPEKVKAGEIFDVDVMIGKEMHPMGQTHWIEYVELSIGNEPAGTVTFRSHGYLKAHTRFSVMLGDELKGKKVSVVATLKCNMHGIWQHYANIEVV